MNAFELKYESPCGNITNKTTREGEWYGVTHDWQYFGRFGSNHNLHRRLRDYRGKYDT